MNLNGRYILSVAVWHVPVLAIGVAGMVLGLVRPVSGRVRGLLVGGSVVIVFATVASAVWSLAVPSILEQVEYQQFERLYLVVGLVTGALQMVGIGMLIASALANRTPVSSATPTPSSYGAPAQGYGAPAPGYGTPPGYGSPSPPSYPPESGWPPPEAPGPWEPPPGGYRSPS
ncbi:MAG TPA: hypothetical protein VFR67_30840 [Pilimelia sp.]|nr:hypothetical protein [Pilimelia sp.]